MTNKHESTPVLDSPNLGEEVAHVSAEEIYERFPELRTTANMLGAAALEVDNYEARVDKEEITDLESAVAWVRGLTRAFPRNIEDDGKRYMKPHPDKHLVDFYGDHPPRRYQATWEQRKREVAEWEPVPDPVAEKLFENGIKVHKDYIRVDDGFGGYFFVEPIMYGNQVRHVMHSGEGDNASQYVETVGIQSQLPPVVLNKPTKQEYKTDCIFRRVESRVADATAGVDSTHIREMGMIVGDDQLVNSKGEHRDAIDGMTAKDLQERYVKLVDQVRETVDYIISHIDGFDSDTAMTLHALKDDRERPATTTDTLPDAQSVLKGRELKAAKRRAEENLVKILR